VKDTAEVTKPECDVHSNDTVGLYNKFYVRHQVNVAAPFDCRVRAVSRATLFSSSSEVYHKLSDHFVSLPEAMTMSASKMRDKVRFDPAEDSFYCGLRHDETADPLWKILYLAEGFETGRIKTMV
jgi:hypothetical protein